MKLFLHCYQRSKVGYRFTVIVLTELLTNGFDLKRLCRICCGDHLLSIDISGHEDQWLGRSGQAASSLGDRSCPVICEASTRRLLLELSLHSPFLFDAPCRTICKLECYRLMFTSCMWYWRDLHVFQRTAAT